MRITKIKTNMYPWLKGHGSIEGDASQRASRSMDEGYPWLKGHGSIEGEPDQPDYSRRNPYPWLKGHGSIEGCNPSAASLPLWEVSMAEGPWLH